MWDNEKFYENIPLHQQWLKMKNAESETLSPELLDFKNLCQQLIQLIKERDLFKPIQFLISERNKLKKIPGMDLKNLNSLYRELMFLNLIQVPPALSVGMFCIILIFINLIYHLSFFQIYLMKNIDQPSNH